MFIQENILATKMNLKNTCQEKIKQDKINLKKTMLFQVEKSIREREEYLQLEFERFKEQNLTEYEEYYRQIIVSYRLWCENQLDDVKKEREKIYKNTKISLEKKYKEIINTKKIKQQRELIKKSEFSLKSSNVRDLKIQSEKESFNKCIMAKVDELNRKDQQLEFCKDKIKCVLNNYSNSLTLALKHRNSDVSYVLDKQKLFQKYLGQPTAVELEQSSQDEEWPKIGII